MTGHVKILGMNRVQAHRLVDAAPAGSIFKIEPPRRTTEQNAKLWAMLSDISQAMPEGRRHTPEDWKAIFMNACGWEVQFIEGLDGRPFPQGFRSSRLTKKQMIDLIEFIAAYGDQQGVQWSNETRQDAA
jgi:hypothetical protein